MYGIIARLARIPGESIVVVQIDRDGKVTSASVQSGQPMLKQSSEENARALRFKPATVPLSQQAVVTFVYRIANAECEVGKGNVITSLEPSGKILIIATPICTETETHAHH